MNNTALLALEDGSLFYGQAIGKGEGIALGEVIFNTAMTGYQEILSDPSYAGQLVTLTHPHVGNVGVNAADNESHRVFAAGLIVRQFSDYSNNWRSETSLANYLIQQDVIGISQIDTRALTRLIRSQGAQRGCIMTGKLDAERAIHNARTANSLTGKDLAKVVTTDYAYDVPPGSFTRYYANKTPSQDKPKYRVVAYDFGIKRSILHQLAMRDVHLHVVPAMTSAKDVLARSPDGVFLSNGPGDPEACYYAIAAVKSLLEHNLPIFGICLGHQILALASGATTCKMKFGHHGANHPVKALASDQVMITSQNHGFAVADDALGPLLEVTHRSLFDGSIQGICRKDKPAFGFQGHPEASPGPHDVQHLFDHFITLMEKYKQADTSLKFQQNGEMKMVESE